ncbi:xanthine/CO dehydrogenase XdhC/CoxF family maturation factor [Streptomyces pseudovenezuelae]|uniref:Xanthine/CO dehydrogenase XdhC/CoxF family maturation factor n=1 Tax=Streptomyces pseudovenezuelae TaxID=67350 RepID=A0ABT6LVJ5_9ACTN|nr:xanthine/CO dehydrogenase XdhC/CoxF family maturation factor [Streptomyces pseudovenezuelae]
MAVVTGVEGSSPRRLGAVSARGSAGELLGGVSGDPLDAALHDLSGRVLADGCPQVARFDTELADPFEPDLPSPGHVEVLVRRVDPGTDEVFALLLASLARGVAVTLALTVDCAHPERVGSALAVTREAVRGTLGAEKWDRECLARRAGIEVEMPEPVSSEVSGGVRYDVQVPGNPRVTSAAVADALETRAREMDRWMAR